MKLKKIVFLLVIVVGISILSFTASATSVNSADVNELTKQKEMELAQYDSGQFCDIYYQGNSDNNTTFLSLNDLPGYKNDNELAKIGGEYIMQKMMTYQNYCKLGNDDGIRYDISPERIVWVIISHYDHTDSLFNFEGKTIKDVTCTSVWDAATGDSISMVIQSDDQSFSDALSSYRNSRG